MSWAKTSRHARGYGTTWDKLRAAVLKRDLHLCQHCLKQGRGKTGTHVDHIKPKAKGGTDALSNLQVLCRSCHDAKTLADKGIKPRLTFGADGWPV